jgi:hypothetical protein
MHVSQEPPWDCDFALFFSFEVSKIHGKKIRRNLKPIENLCLSLCGRSMYQEAEGKESPIKKGTCFNSRTYQPDSTIQVLRQTEIWLEGLD